MTFERACINNGLIIDTNLLILLLVGYYKAEYISDCKLTSRYSLRDFEYISNIVKTLKPKIIVTPHILSELSNQTFTMLSGTSFDKYFGEVMALLTLAKEKHIKKEALMIKPKLLGDFGFTDMSIIEAAKKYDYAVITDDSSFYTYLLKEGCTAESLINARAYASVRT